MKHTFKMAAALLLGFAGLVGTAAQAKDIVYWSMWNEPEPQAQALRAIMALYKKSHPDVNFKVVWNGRQNQTKLRGALQAGTAVDVMDQDGDQLYGGLQAAGAGLELTPLLGDDIKAAMLPGTLNLYATGGTQIYSLPYIYNTVNFWFNKELMQEAGASVPKTWSDLLKVCQAVKKNGQSALVIEGNIADYNMLYFSHLVERQLGANAMLGLFADKSGNGWMQPAVKQALAMSRDLWAQGCIAKESRGFQYPAGQQTIALGDSMAALVGSWLPAELKSSAGKDFPWGAFNFPAVEGGKGKASDLQVALLSMMVLKNAPNKDGAVDFVKFMVSEPAQKIMAEQGGVGPTRKGVKWPAVLADAQSAASGATALSNFGGGLKMTQPEFTAKVLAPGFNKFFLGEQTADQLMAELAKQTKAHWDAVASKAPAAKPAAVDKTTGAKK